MNLKVPSQGAADNGSLEDPSEDRLILVFVVVLDEPGDPVHDGWLDRGYAEREARGLELAAAGWTP